MSERGPTHTPADIQKSQELEQSDNFEGLHARLLLANNDLFNPGKDVLQSRRGHVKKFDRRNYQAFERVSERSRKAEVEASGETYNTWIKGVTETVKGIEDTKRSEVFDPLFHKAGIKSDASHEFTDRDAKKIYDHYFSTQDPHDSDKKRDPNKRGVKLFVKDVLEAHGESALDKDKLESIKGYASIFGDESVNMIEQLIKAELRLQSEPDFIKKVPLQRVNELLPEEKRILEQIHGAREAEKVEKKQDLMDNLPIMEHRDTIRKKILEDEMILLVGGTGCGKTVGFPFMIREIMQEARERGEDPGSFIITEPTIINTESLAEKIASDGGDTLGYEVDYQHGQREGSYNKQADTVLMTQRSLINRFLKGDKEINKMRYLMIDEAHALSTDTVLLMALGKEEQQRRKDAGEPSLSIFVASATIDEKEFTKHLGVEITKIPGQIQEIKEVFPSEPIDISEFPKKAAEDLRQVIESGAAGDYITFVPGKRGKAGIEATIAAMNAEIQNNKLEQFGKIHPPIGLESKSPDDVKEQAKEPRKDGKRKIIASTNFAETGITIKGLKFVSDSGLRNEAIYDPQTKMQTTKTVKASRDEVMQRRGRVGRIEPGEWHPMYTEDDFNGKSKDGTGELRPLHIRPEIMQTDLKDIILLMKRYGKDIREMDLLYKPEDAQMDVFEKDLVALGALKKDGTTTRITPLGREMTNISRNVEDIHHQRMIADTALHHRDMLDTVCAVIAIAQENSIFGVDQSQKPKEAMTILQRRDSELIDPTSDLMTFQNIWQAYKKVDSKERRAWAEERGLNPDKLHKVQRVKNEFLKVRKTIAAGEQSTTSLHEIIANGYADRVMKQDPENEKRYIWEDGTQVDLDLLIGDRSFVGSASRIVAADLYQPEGSNQAYLSKVHTLEIAS